MSTILLERAYLPDESAVLGRWTMPDGLTCYTLENPWRGNQRSVSCIPEGVYDMALRDSEIVRRTSGGQFREGWEILDVPGRTFIMVHPGNWAHDTEGCILVGPRFSWSEDGPMLFPSSRDTFSQLMESLSGQDRWTIDIRVKTVEYP